MKINILIVEDESSISDFVKGELEYEGYQVSIKEDGREGLKEALENDYDLIILDIMLPSMNGFEICRRLKREKNTPIIMLSAKDSVMDKVNGLQIGADDYITKPFNIEEVLARVLVQMRRRNQEDTSETLSCKEMTLHRDTFQIEIQGQELPRVTKQEFAILELLLRNPKKVFSKEEIFEYAWDEVYMGETKTLDVHISNIRKKIKQVTDEGYIETVWGIGYRLQR